jgi:hypothetical protein
MSDDVLISSFEQLPNVLTVAVTAYLIFEDKKEKYTVCIRIPNNCFENFVSTKFKGL